MPQCAKFRTPRDRILRRKPMPDTGQHLRRGHLCRPFIKCPEPFDRILMRPMRKPAQFRLRIHGQGQPPIRIGRHEGRLGIARDPPVLKGQNQRLQPRPTGLLSDLDPTCPVLKMRLVVHDLLQGGDQLCQRHRLGCSLRDSRERRHMFAPMRIALLERGNCVPHISRSASREAPACILPTDGLRNGG